MLVSMDVVFSTGDFTAHLVNRQATNIYFCLIRFFMSQEKKISYAVRVLLGWTSTMQGIMCLAQGHKAVTLVMLEPTTRPTVSSPALYY